MSEITKDRILEALQDGKHLTIKEIAEKLAYSHKYTARLCAELWQENKIIRVRAENGVTLRYFIMTSVEGGKILKGK